MLVNSNLNNPLDYLHRPIRICLSSFTRKLTHKSLITLLVAVLLCVPLETKAQTGFDSNYLFDGTITDESSVYDLVLTGTDSFSSGSNGQVFNLIGESYLDVPLAHRRRWVKSAGRDD